MGIPCDGWDPVYRPYSTKAAAPVINLGYVLNVIEDPAERRDVLQQAWDLCEDVLVVSALVAPDSSEAGNRTSYNDGVLSTRGTFQKYFTHMELRAYLQDITPGRRGAGRAEHILSLQERRIPAARSCQSICSPRCSSAPTRIRTVIRATQGSSLSHLCRLLPISAELPGPEEFEQSAAFIEAVGSLKRALQIVARATGQQPWQDIGIRRREDLLVLMSGAYIGSGRGGHYRACRFRSSGILRRLRATIRVHPKRRTGCCFRWEMRWRLTPLVSLHSSARSWTTHL